MNGDYQSNGRDQVDTFDIRTSVRSIGEAIRHYKWLVILTCLFTVGVVTLYIMLWPPVYRAEATLMAEKDIDASRDAFYLNWSVFRKDDAQTEIELMKTAPVLEELIRREHLGYDDVYHPFFSYLAHLWQVSWPGRTYQGFKDKLFSGGGEEAGLNKAQVEMGKAMVDMASGISVEPVGETNVGKLTLRGPSTRVGHIANTLLDIYLLHRDERHQTEAQNSYRVLTDELKKAGVELDDIAAKRLGFARENDVTFDFQKETIEVGKLAELEADIGAGRSKVATLDATIAEFNRELTAEPETRTTLRVFSANAQREALKGKRTELESQMLQMRAQYRDDSPEIGDIKKDIARLDELIAGMQDRIESSRTEAVNELRQDLNSKRTTLQADLAGTRAGLAVMESTAASMRTRLSNLTTLQTEMKTLERAYTVANEKYQLLLGKQAQASMSGTSAKAVMPSIRIVERATTPSSKSWPSLKILYPSAIALGLVLGIAMAVVASYASGRVRREYVDRIRGSSPFYGHITVSTSGLPIKVQERSSAMRASSNGPSQN
jgi:uncharacterized protein involved in exopolysaccharide biosynthesis